MYEYYTVFYSAYHVRPGLTDRYEYTGIQVKILNIIISIILRR